MLAKALYQRFGVNCDNEVESYGHISAPHDIPMIWRSGADGHG